MLKSTRSFFISVVLSIALLLFLFSSIQTGSLLDLFKNIYWPGFAFYLFFTFVGFTLRAQRYCWLIGVGKVEVHQMLLLTFVRQVFVDLLPMKIGEFSYVVLLKKRFNIPVEVGLSTMFAVIFIDAICVIPLLILALSVTGKMQIIFVSGQSYLWVLLFFLTMIGAFYYLDKIIAFLSRGIHFCLQILLKQKQAHWIQTIDEKIKKTSEELKLLKKKKIYFKTILLSFVIRICKYLSLFSVLYALVHSQGISIESLNFFKVLIGVAGAELSSFLPIQGLAGFGTWEAAWALAFQWMGFSKDLAILTGIGTHLITQVTEYIVGAICLLVLWLPIRKGTGVNTSTKSE